MNLLPEEEEFVKSLTYTETTFAQSIKKTLIESPSILEDTFSDSVRRVCIDYHPLMLTAIHSSLQRKSIALYSASPVETTQWQLLQNLLYILRTLHYYY